MIFMYGKVTNWSNCTARKPKTPPQMDSDTLLVVEPLHKMMVVISGREQVWALAA